jgi:hypothetical protein
MTAATRHAGDPHDELRINYDASGQASAMIDARNILGLRRD